MKAVGTKTAIITSTMATRAPPTSSMVIWAASRGVTPRRRCRSMFSTTTMASSTTMPMASTRPNSDRLLIEKPAAAITARVPIRQTGMAMIGMIAVRQLCRKIITTRTTRTSASSRVFSASTMEARTYSVGL